MKYSFITLRFIQSPPTSPKSDHIVQIKKNGDDYLWFYSDHCPRGQAVWMTKDEVFAALDNMRKLLRWDSEPYKSVQVFIPGFPTVMIPLKYTPVPPQLAQMSAQLHVRQHWTELELAFDDLKGLMESVFSHWPENMSSDEVRKMDPDNVYNDDKDDEDEDDENDDEDDEDDEDEEMYGQMPPLVSFPISESEIPSAAQRLCCMHSQNPQTPVRSTPPQCPAAPPRVKRSYSTMNNEIVDDAPPAQRTRSKAAAVHSFWS